MKRLHCTSTPLYKFRNCPKQRLFQKPNGLWYGIDNEWIDYYNAYVEPDYKFPYCYDIEIDESKILIISNEEQLLEFSKKYQGIIDGLPDNMPGFEYPFIDWTKVAQDYSGIEISPYIESGRLSLIWYYPWDIASGCIWKSDAIKNITLLK